jgi:hypothetical protein
MNMITTLKKGYLSLIAKLFTMLEEHLTPMGENNTSNSKVWKFGDVLNVTQNDHSRICVRHMKILFILQAIKL